MAKESGTPQGRIRGMANLASLGIHMVVATFIGLFIGIYLDKYFSTAPWLMIVFFLLGIGAGFKNIFTAAKRYGFTDDADEDNGGGSNNGDDKGNGGKSGNGDERR